ncbi:hypothetical protein HK105_207336 [Polyrhizophydium stewartii]|uniref:DUF8032 domain-containing protein n=1 Tax=Polyrhizophydium stewartii TaxID=2732419 RepID=A0ABR4N126_9FUNG|nr:hypothetical protein HK105_000789 [Polyrhizophydium stewartii]
MASSGSRAQRKRPLTIPNALEIRDGVEWLTFTYTSRGVGTQFTIRIDIDSVGDHDLTADFRVANSVYPRANVPHDEYRGNRWQYESTVNEIGWRLAFLNPALVGKRGLLQRAVDSFRNRFPDMKSRRVARVEKHDGGDGPSSSSSRKHHRESMPVLPPRSPPALVEALVARPAQAHGHGGGGYSHAAAAYGRHYSEEDDEGFLDEDYDADVHDAALRDADSHHLRKRPRPSAAAPMMSSARAAMQMDQDILVVETIRENVPFKFPIRINVASIDEPPSSDFRKRYKLFQNVAPKGAATPAQRLKRDRETRCNELAWRLALLNPHSLGKSRCLLQRAVDTYMTKFDDIQLRPRPAKRTILDTPHLLSA